MKLKLLALLFSVAVAVAPARAASNAISPDVVVKSVEHEFGGMRHNYFGRNWRVNEQIFMGMGVPNPDKPVADGNILMSGCRRHSCDEKSAIIVTRAGAMLAAGMIYFRCPDDLDKRKPPIDCDFRPYFRIFLKQKNNRPALVQELKRLGGERKVYRRAGKAVSPAVS